jgi:tRNA(fMet)-specific endonuclease VapC
MNYQLDSGWVIDFLAGDVAAQARIDPLFPSGAALSVVTLMEVYEGVELSDTRRQDERQVRTVLRAVTVLPLNRTVARRAARVRADLRQRGRSVRRRALDILIAATALTYDLTLVTRNHQDYRDIPGLKLG